MQIGDIVNLNDLGGGDCYRDGDGAVCMVLNIPAPDVVTDPAMIYSVPVGAGTDGRVRTKVKADNPLQVYLGRPKSPVVIGW